MIRYYSKRVKKTPMNRINGINPLILKWARETAGFSIEQVVHKLSRKKITAQTIAAWECGESAPDYIQLERLAYEIYKRPLAIFFFPEPPFEETPRQAFRTLPNSEIDDLSQHLRFLIRQAKSMQFNLAELYEGTNPAGRQLLRDIPFSIGIPVTELANSVRQFLKIELNTQLQWKSIEEAFKEWRNAVEECGIFVFKDAFKSEAVSGFCLYDKLFPIIYINNSRPMTHQIFTLFHELAHLLSGTGGIDAPIERYIHQLRGKNKQIEVLCSDFAGTFLVPDVDFDERITKLSIDEDSIEELADNYKVSREVILRRLVDKKLVTSDYYGQMVTKWRSIKQDKTSGGGDYYRTKRAYLGERYLELVFSHFYQHKISIDQVADYLGVKVSSVPGMEGLLVPKDMVA
jgi:Zn-dependent peptidase ImmA (M78 family)